MRVGRGAAANPAKVTAGSRIRPTIVAVAGDPGGARALAPVIARLLLSGDVDVVALAYLHARSVWAERDIAFSELASDGSLDVEAELVRTRPSIVVTATSVNSIDLETQFVAAAARLGIPSVSVLDFWANYRQRFIDTKGNLVLPDRIAIMDEASRAEMVALGFPPATLKVTGQPALEEIGLEARTISEAEQHSTRAAAGVPGTGQLVLFVSQPLAGGPTDWGYSELTVIPDLIAALANIGRKRGERLELLIRPHPKETPSRWATPDSDTLGVTVSTVGDRLRVAMAADLVVGMTSVLLVEACLLGCVVVSLQPGLRGTDSLPTNRLGASKAIYSKAALEPVLEELIFSPEARAEVRARCQALQNHGDAARNIETLIFAMIDDAGNPSSGTVDT